MALGHSLRNGSVPSLQKLMQFRDHNWWGAIKHKKFDPNTGNLAANFNIGRTIFKISWDLQLDMHM
eukprot:12412373-Karenia_brevis.AAC.1